MACQDIFCTVNGVMRDFLEEGKGQQNGKEISTCFGVINIRANPVILRVR